MTHKVCGSVECAITHGERIKEKARKKKEKADLANLKVRKEAIKTVQELKAEAQVAFNAFIRQRDIGQNCICCNKPFEPNKIGGSIDAGHYLGRGMAPHLRFEENNCHAQRKNCNRPGGTTRAAFRAGMEARIGLEALEALESNQTIVKWNADMLRGIRDKYRAKLKELKGKE